jgi:hypothetical protein
MSLADHPISEPNLDISGVCTPLSQQRSENYNTVQYILCVKIVFCICNVQRICLFIDDFYSDWDLILTIAVKQYMDIRATPHEYELS